MELYLQLYEKIAEFLDNLPDYPENQANVPAEPEQQPCVSVTDPVQGKPQDTAQSPEMTSEWPNILGTVLTQNSVTHAGETLPMPLGEPRKTVSESQQAGLLSQTKPTAGSQVRAVNDTPKSLLTSSQEATYRGSKLGVSNEGSQKKIFSDKKILDMDQSLALCGGQEETFSGNQTPPSGSHVVAFDNSQTSSEDHSVTSQRDQTVWRQMTTFSGYQISCDTQISLSGDKTHSGAQRSPSDNKILDRHHMSPNHNLNLYTPHVYPSFNSHFCGTQMSPRWSHSIYGSQMSSKGNSDNCGTQMYPQGNPYFYGLQMNPSVNSTISGAQTTHHGNQSLHGTQMGATENPTLYNGQNICRDQIGMNNDGQTHNMGLNAPNLNYLASDGGQVMNSEVLYASNAPLTQRYHPEYFPGYLFMQEEPSEPIWRMQKAPNLWKRYICPYPDCGKAYSKDVRLQIHIRVHTGERPYVCDVQGCTWKFSRSDGLLRHKRKHNGERPYQCTSCNKNFTRSDHLRQHQRNHSNLSPHTGTLTSSANMQN